MSDRRDVVHIWYQSGVEREFEENQSEGQKSYGPWKTKITSALDAEDCLEIVLREEFEPKYVAPQRIDGILVNSEVLVQYRADVKDFKKRSKKATAIITQTIDDSLVMSLDVLDRDPCLIWEKLAEDFSKVTPAEKSSARMAFLTLKIPSSESYLDTKHRFDKLLRQVAVQGGTI